MLGAQINLNSGICGIEIPLVTTLSIILPVLLTGIVYVLHLSASDIAQSAFHRVAIQVKLREVKPIWLSYVLLTPMGG